MKAIRKFMLFLAAMGLAAMWVPLASAGCADAHLKQQSWDGPAGAAPEFLLASEGGHSDHGPSMVGLWHVLFIAHGNGPNLPPDGAQVDNALSAWHPDGTEETVSSRAPATGDVCMGVWKLVGERHYTLNHFGISFDPSTDPNTPLGFADIRQNIMLSPDGKTFRGTFTIDQYDSAGNLLVEIKGYLHGNRIDGHTTVPDLVNQS